MKTSDILTIAVIVLLPAAALWFIFIARTRTKDPAARLGIPKALRPGLPDEVLEGRRLERIMIFGVLSTLALAAFIPAYWLPETGRQETFQERQDETSIERGFQVFGAPPSLEEAEGGGPAKFKEVESAIALGQNCAQCHGPAVEGTPEETWAAGGLAANKFIDPITGNTVQYVAPPLNNVFTRWDEEVIRFTIEHGRPGTPMPAWGVAYGGSMTTQMVDDLMAWVRTLPGNNEAPGGISEDCANPEPFDLKCGQEIFTARCAVCHGPEGQGKDDTGEDADRAWHQGMALWKGKVEHLTTAQHLFTVINGRRFAFMPPFSDAPEQGIPPNPYPLTMDQIRAVVNYERSL